LNETDYGDSNATKWRTEAGKFGAGFVWYLPGNMSKTESIEELKKFRNTGIFDNEMLLTSAEFMFYNNNINIGVIQTYYFFRT